MAKTEFWGDTELARIKPLLPGWHPWYVYTSTNHISWHAHPDDSPGPILHSDSPDGIVARVHEFDLSEGR
jgi:hypothetical protein